MVSSRLVIEFKDSSRNISARLSGVARDGSVCYQAEDIKFLSKRKLHKESIEGATPFKTSMHISPSI